MFWTYFIVGVIIFITLLIVIAQVRSDKNDDDSSFDPNSG